MAIETQKFIRKPLFVDAVRISTDNFAEIVAWCQGEVQEEEGKSFIKVRVHNPKNQRQTKAFIGDWLLYTERGYKVYTTKAFHASFDVADMEEVVAELVEEASGVVEVRPEEVGLPLDTPAAEVAEAASLEYSPRVLSVLEQSELAPEVVTEMLKTGEVVLAQDLPTKE